MWDWEPSWYDTRTILIALLLFAFGVTVFDFATQPNQTIVVQMEK